MLKKRKNPKAKTSKDAVSCIVLFIFLRNICNFSFCLFQDYETKLANIRKEMESKSSTLENEEMKSLFLTQVNCYKSLAYFEFAY